MAVPTSRKLWNIIKNNDIEGFHAFIKDGGSVMANRNSDDKNAFEIALEEGSQRMASAIIGAVIKTDDRGHVELNIVNSIVDLVKSNNHEIVKQVLDFNPDLYVNKNYSVEFGASNRMDMNIATIATVFGSLETLQVAFEAGSRPNMTSVKGVPLAWYSRDAGIYQEYIRRGFDETRFDMPFSAAFHALQLAANLASDEDSYSIDPIATFDMFLNKDKSDDRAYVTSFKDDSTLFTDNILSADYKKRNRLLLMSNFSIIKPQIHEDIFRTMISHGLTHEGLVSRGIKNPLLSLINIVVSSESYSEHGNVIDLLLKNEFTLEGSKISDLSKSFYHTMQFTHSAFYHAKAKDENINFIDLLQLHTDAGLEIKSNWDSNEDDPNLLPSSVYTLAINSKNIEIIDFIFDHSKDDMDKVLNDHFIKHVIKTGSSEVYQHVLELYAKNGLENPITHSVFNYATDPSIVQGTDGEILNMILDDIEDVESLISPTVKSTQDSQRKKRIHPPVQFNPRNSKLIHLLKGTYNHVEDATILSVFTALLSKAERIHQDDERTVLSYACACGDTADYLRAIVDKFGKESLFIAGKDGTLPIHAAFEAGNIAAAKYIFEQVGAEPFIGSELSVFAIYNGNPEEMFKLLEEHSIPINELDEFGRSPFFPLFKYASDIVSFDNFRKITSRLVDSGCDINERDNEGNSPVSCIFNNSTNNSMATRFFMNSEMFENLSECNADMINKDGSHVYSPFIDRNVYSNDMKKKKPELRTDAHSFIEDLLSEDECTCHSELAKVVSKDGLSLVDMFILNNDFDEYKSLKQCGIGTTINTEVIQDRYSNMVDDLANKLKSPVSHDGGLSRTALDAFHCIGELVANGYKLNYENSKLVVAAICKTKTGIEDNDRELNIYAEILMDSALERHPEIATKTIYINENELRNGYVSAESKTMLGYVFDKGNLFALKKLLDAGANPNIYYGSHENLTSPMNEGLSAITVQNKDSVSDFVKNTAEMIYLMLEAGGSVELAEKISGIEKEELLADMHPFGVEAYLRHEGNLITQTQKVEKPAAAKRF